MKILHIIPMYFPAFKYGGPSVSIHALNKSLVKKGIEVSVMTTVAGLENMSSIKRNEWIKSNCVGLPLAKPMEPVGKKQLPM